MESKQSSALPRYSLHDYLVSKGSTDGNTAFSLPHRLQSKIQGRKAYEVNSLRSASSVSSLNETFVNSELARNSFTEVRKTRKSSLLQRPVPVIPKVPHIIATRKAFEALKDGLSERLNLLRDLIQRIENEAHSAPSSENIVFQTNSILTTLHDLVTKMERRYSRVLALQEDYEIILQLREDCKTQIGYACTTINKLSMRRVFLTAYERVSILGHRRLPSLLQNHPIDYKSLSHYLCQIEAQLSCLLGCMCIRITGLEGLARLSPGDEYEVHLSYGSSSEQVERSNGTLTNMTKRFSLVEENELPSQRWQAKGVVLSDGRKQNWNGNAFTRILQNSNEMEVFENSPWRIVFALIEGNKENEFPQARCSIGGMLLHLVVNDLLKIKTYQCRRLGGVRRIGRDDYDVLQLLTCRQKVSTLSTFKPLGKSSGDSEDGRLPYMLRQRFELLVNNLGTLRLHFISIWIPLEDFDEIVDDNFAPTRTLETIIYNPYISNLREIPAIRTLPSDRLSLNVNSPSLDVQSTSDSSENIFSPSAKHRQQGDRFPVQRRDLKRSTLSQPNLFQPGLNDTLDYLKADTTESNSEVDLLEHRDNSHFDKKNKTINLENEFQMIFNLIDELNDTQLELLLSLTSALRLWHHHLSQKVQQLHHTDSVHVSPDTPLPNNQRKNANFTLKSAFAFLDLEEYGGRNSQLSSQDQSDTNTDNNDHDIPTSGFVEVTLAIVPMLKWHLALCRHLLQALSSGLHVIDRCVLTNQQTAQVRIQIGLFPWSNDCPQGKVSKIMAALLEQAHILHHLYQHRVDMADLLSHITESQLLRNDENLHRFINRAFPSSPIDSDLSYLLLLANKAEHSITKRNESVNNGNGNNLCGIVSCITVSSILVRKLESMEWSQGLDHPIKLAVSQSFVGELIYRELFDDMEHIGQSATLTQLYLSKRAAFSHLDQNSLDDLLQYLALQESLSEQLQSHMYEDVLSAVERCHELVQVKNSHTHDQSDHSLDEINTQPTLPQTCWMRICNILLRVDLFEITLSDNPREGHLKDAILEKVANLLQMAAYSTNASLRRGLLDTLFEQLENPRSDRDSIQARCSAITVLANLTHKFQMRQRTLWDMASSMPTANSPIPAWLLNLVIIDESSTVRQHAKNTLHHSWPHAKLVLLQVEEPNEVEHRF